MSKETQLALECPGCNIKIYYTEFHKCSNATGLLNFKVESPVVEPKKRKRRRKHETLDQSDGQDE